jgi:hypothetical protein
MPAHELDAAERKLREHEPSFATLPEGGRKRLITAQAMLTRIATRKQSGLS